MAQISTLKPTIVAADNAGNDLDYDAWVKITKLVDAISAGQLQGGKNFFDNSALQIWQRGTSFAFGAVAPHADRWKSRRSANAAGGTISRQTGFSNAQYCARVQRDAADSATNAMIFGQQITSASVAFFAGKTVILSADVRAGADFSSASMLLGAQLSTGTGTDETWTGTFPTGNANNTLTAQTISTTAARISWPAFAVPSNATEMMPQFTYTPVGTAGAADYFEITNVQLEIADATNPVATPYERLPMAVVMAVCERFLEKSFALATTPAQNVGVNTGEIVFPAPAAGANSERSPTVRFRSRKRTTPTITLYNPAAANAQVRDETASADCTSSTVVNNTEDGFRVTATGNASTAVGGALGYHFLASAEL